MKWHLLFSKIITVSLLISFGGPLGLAAPLSDDDVKTHTQWGNLEEVKQFENFYLSSVPSKKALQEFKKKKVATVIDLRPFKEKDCDSMTAAQSLGMKYIPIFFDKTQPIDSQVIKDIDKAVAENSNKPILIYCSSGTRAAAWLATYLVRTQNKTTSEALTIAKSAGLKSPDMEEKVQEYLLTIKK